MHLSLSLDPSSNPSDPEAPLQSELQTMVAPQIFLEDHKTTQAFVDGIMNSSLRDGHLPESILQRILNPARGPLETDQDPDLRLSLGLWRALGNSALETYESVRREIERDPRANIQMLSLNRVQRQVDQITGVLPIHEDMCINSCVNFVGPFADAEICPMCLEQRYEPQSPSSRGPRKPRKRSLTIPLGPQLQALYRSPQMAEAMQYRHQAMSQAAGADYNIDVFQDWVHGTDPLEAAINGDLHEDSIALFYSTDGCQLLRDKQSDCWIAIWVVAELSPDRRYKKKHVLVSNIIPGPKKPKNQDFFMFTSFQHLRVLQRDRLPVWDASTNTICYKTLFFVFGTADLPGMAALSGHVGHTGCVGCRCGCGQIGRHKQGSGIYFPACLRPDNYNVEGCMHDDIDLRAPLHSGPSAQERAAAQYQRDLRYVLASVTQTEYKQHRLETGIAKATIFSGIPSDCRLSIPGLFPGDIMHLLGLNIPELLIGLWRGDRKLCDKTDNIDTWDWAVLTPDVWKAHGQAVGDCYHHFPGCFDSPPLTCEIPDPLLILVNIC